MARLRVKKDVQISLVEETWWSGDLDGKPLAVYAKVFRCDQGEWEGQIGASANLHRPKGGGFTVSSGPPNPEELCWGNSREDAIEKALG